MTPFRAQYQRLLVWVLLGRHAANATGSVAENPPSFCRCGSTAEVASSQQTASAAQPRQVCAQLLESWKLAVEVSERWTCKEVFLSPEGETGTVIHTCCSTKTAVFLERRPRLLTCRDMKAVGLFSRSSRDLPSITDLSSEHRLTQILVRQIATKVPTAVF